MARVLVAWELGAGWGHVARLRPLATALRQRGHEVVVALRDIAVTGKLFVREGVPCLAAPFKLGWPENSIRPAQTFAHVLHNVGFASFDELDSLACAWESLFDLIDPDVIVFDHSPTALLASRSINAKRVLLGDGFCCPPAGESLPPLAPWRSVDIAKATTDESRTLAIANRILKVRGLRPLDRLADLYQDADAQFLTTFAELDHFGPRQDGAYCGPGVCSLGRSVEWPIANSNARAVAYVRPTPQLPTLIKALNSHGIETLMYCPGDKPVGVRSSGLVRIFEHPIDLGRAAESADFAILNASHGTTAEMLLRGVPVLQLPLHMEQQLVAYRTVTSGTGLAANPAKPEVFSAQIDRLLSDRRYRDTAWRFRDKYREFNAARATQTIADRVESLVAAAA
jgi:hypothetical protein